MKQYAPWIFFAITLLPLGLINTLYGQMAALLIAIVLGLSFAFLPAFYALSEPGMRLLQRLSPIVFESRERHFLIVVSAAFFLMAFASAYFSNGCIPAIQDSVSQYLEARILAGGQVSAPGYPLGQFFDLRMMINDDRYYSIYPPGHIFILTPAMWLGVPCAVNPLLGALTCVAIFYLTRAVYDAKTARIAALLTLGCAFLLHMSAEFMNHATTLLFACIFFLGFIRVLQKPSLKWSLAAGFAIAYVSITRPLTGAALALPFACYALYLLARNPRMIARFIWMALGVLPPIAAFLWFNHATTGDAFSLSYQKLGHNPLGFGPVPVTMLQWVGRPDHTLLHGLGMMFNNMNAMHWYLFDWPTSSLLFVPIAFMRRKPRAIEWLLLAACLSLFLAYILFYLQSWIDGPRFQYEIVGILIMFSAYGIIRAVDYRPRLAFVIAACAVFGVLFNMSNVASMEGRGAKLLPARTIEARITKPTLLFVPFGEEYWRLAAMTYPPQEGDLWIVARDLGEENKKLMALYPAREAYRADHIGTKDEIWERLR